jgi:hypothetical protein
MKLSLFGLNRVGHFLKRGELIKLENKLEALELW